MSKYKVKKVLEINIDNVELEGELTVPQNASGLVLFAHGSGSSRFSPRNNYVSNVMNENGLATFLVDLLTKKEDIDYDYRFNIDLLAKRLVKITEFLKHHEDSKGFKIGYFGASTGAAAAIKASVSMPESVSAIVSRGGRVDLAGPEISFIKAPILFIVGERDDFVLGVNVESMKKVTGKKHLAIVKNATHLFEEPGALEEVAQLSTQWFCSHLKDF